MSTVEMVIEKCTANSKGQFVVKMITEGISSGDDLNKVSGKRTFYSSIPEAKEIGQKVKVNMEAYKVAEYPYDVPNATTGEMVTIQLKWLQLK